MICLTEQEWENLKEENKKILEETVKQAVKEATVPLLAEISALQTEVLLYKTNYGTIFGNYSTLQTNYNSLKGWNKAGWIISFTELTILILSWTLN